MINGTAAKEGLAIRREDVYICNVVKCRPPENRTRCRTRWRSAASFCSASCSPFVPKAICVLGGTAAKRCWVPGRASPNCAETGRTGTHSGHADLSPSFLLRPYSQNAKRESWEDLKKCCTMSSTERPQRGHFITFEGLDGTERRRRCGCSPRICASAARTSLRRSNRAARPSASIRRILLDPAHDHLGSVPRCCCTSGARTECA